MSKAKSTKKTFVALQVRFSDLESYARIREAARVSNAGSINAFIVAVTTDAANTVLKGSTPTPGQLAGENLTRS